MNEELYSSSSSSPAPLERELIIESLKNANNLLDVIEAKLISVLG